MKNVDILNVTLYSISAQMFEDIDRHRRTDLKLRIDDRDLQIVSDYKDRHYDILDANTGEVVAIQLSEDSLTEIDVKWLNKECETYYKEEVK